MDQILLVDELEKILIEKRRKARNIILIGELVVSNQGYADTTMVTVSKFETALRAGSVKINAYMR